MANLALGYRILGELRAFSKKCRDLVAENAQLKIDLSLQEKATQAEAEEVDRLKAQLAERQNEHCENCEHACGRSEFPNMVTIQCYKPNREYHWYPSHFKCCYYTAKPKVRKCRWVMKKMGTNECWITKDKYSPEDEFILKNSELVVGPVEGTWEEG